MKKSDYTISNIYQGGHSSLKPSYFSGSDTYIQAGSLGMTTDPRSANILKEVSDKLSMGVKAIEIEGVSPEVFDSIPKQQLKEVNRLSKLTGTEMTLHGPVSGINMGFTQQGFNETQRQNVERQIADVLIRAKELNPKGNIPVNFHTAEGYPGSQFLPPEESKKQGSKYKQLLVVNKDSGQIAPMESEERYQPGKEGAKKIKYTPEKKLNMLNATEWDNSISKIEFDRIRAEEILTNTDPVTRGLYINWIAMQSQPDLVSEEAKKELNNLSPQQQEQMRKIHAAATYTEQAMRAATDAFDKAYKNAPSNEEKHMLKEISKKYSQKLGVKDNGIQDMRSLDPKTQSEALFDLIQGLEKTKPELWVPLEEFATKKTAETFGNSAFKTYKELKGKNVPTLIIENPPVGFGLSRGEDVKNVVEQSRKTFVENAIKEGMNKKKAEKEAEKLIGATWDVGHINMLRKQGFSEEDIVKESEKVAPLVKHVHLSDNFGFEHTELPMGMGNVPLKQIMEKLGKKGFEAKKIIEAGNWWQHFQTAPFQQSLEAFGSPIYSMKRDPSWNQAIGLQESYFGGYGQMLPQTNYETFGAGFSRLPQELGGQQPGGQGNRMSGRPME